MNRILLIEDNVSIAEGLARTLEQERYDVCVSHSGEEGLAAFSAFRPDLVILDLMLPGMDGLEVLRAIRSMSEDVGVLILSARVSEGEKLLGFRGGADDYLTKPFGLLELLARVDAQFRRLRRDQTREHAQRFHVADLEIDAARRTVRRGEHAIDLRPKEFDLLLALLRSRGEVVSRQRLLHDVWGYDDDVHSRTVDTHLVELRRKLGDDPSTPQYILTVRKTGYRLLAEVRVGELL